MEFPVLVYKKGGPHQCKGGTFDYVAANDEEELEARLADGWLLDLAEVTGEAAKAAPADDAPPAREELEQKAAELKIKFSAKTSDADLGKLIADKLKG